MNPRDIEYMKEHIQQVQAEQEEWMRKQISSKVEGKPQMHLLPVEALPGVARAMESSLADGRYTENDWRKPERVDIDFLDAAVRHLFAELLDPGGVDADSGQRHIDHVLATAMIYSARTLNHDKEPNQ